MLKEKLLDNQSVLLMDILLEMKMDLKLELKKENLQNTIIEHKTMTKDST